MSKLNANLLLLFTAFLWGASFIATEYLIVDNFNPLSLIFFRFVIGALFIYLFNFKKINKHFKRNIRIGVISGFFLFFGFLFQVLGQTYSSPSNTSFLTSTSLIYISIFSVVFTKVKLSKKTLLGIVLTIFGIGFLTIQPGFNILLGDILSLICAMMFAAHSFICWHYMQKSNVSVITFTFIQFVTAAFISLVFSLLGGVEQVYFNVGQILPLLYLGVVASFLCFYLRNIAQKYLSAPNAALIGSTESGFATILSVSLLGEMLSFNQILGIILIMAAILVSQINLTKKC